MVAGCTGAYGLKSLPFKIASRSECLNNSLPWLKMVIIFDQRGKYQLNLNFKENRLQMLVSWKFEGFTHDSNYCAFDHIFMERVYVNSLIATTSCKQPTSISNHFENNHFVS